MGATMFFVKEETGIVSHLTNLTEGSYQVVVDDGAFVYYSWVFEPQLTGVEIEVVKANCSKLALNAKVDLIRKFYFDPRGDRTQLVPLDYGLTYKWSSDPDGSIEGKDKQEEEIEAPFEKTTYNVVVTDNVGNQVEDDHEYKAIAVEAEFSFEEVARGIEHELDTVGQRSAPLVVKFKDESKGGITAYEWDFGEAGKRYEKEPVFTFQYPGTYKVFLYVVNESEDSGCESHSKEVEFSIKEGFLDVPNAFTPNGDGANDEFRVAYRSLKKFHLVIYNRWGRKVYSSNNPEQGWDGKIGGAKASPGVYFYVIEAEGYEDGENYKKHGTVHLIRGN